MSQPIRDRGGNFVFRNGPKNKNLVDNFEILLLGKTNEHIQNKERKTNRKKKKNKRRTHLK